MRRFCAIMFLAASFPAFAGTYYFSLDGDDANDGSGWASAKSNLQGFVLAQTNGGHYVYVSNGVWTMTNSHLLVAKNMTIEGLSSNGTVLAGSGTNRVVCANGTNVWLRSLTITGGNSYTYPAGGAGVRGYGSAAANRVNITNCVIVSNVFGWTAGVDGVNGGGVCRANVYNSLIDSCRATNTDNSGGAGAYQSYIYDSTIQNCSAEHAHGGGYFLGAAYRSTIRSNYAKLNGGGYYNAVAVDCLIVSNKSGAGGGGGYAYGSNNVFEYNYGGTGGGVGDYSIQTNSIIRYNTTVAGGIGGGAYGNAVRLYGCQVVSNTAATSGCGGGAVGGKYYRCLFAGNRAPDGGAGTDAYFYDCVIDGNSAWANPAGRDFRDVIGCTVLNHTNKATYLISGNTRVYNTVIFNNVSNRLQTTNVQAIYTNDPSFLPGSYKISSSSPCVDAGNNTYATTLLDFYGRDRVVDGGTGTATVDIGAAEYQSGIDDPVSSSRKKLFLPLLFE